MFRYAMKAAAGSKDQLTDRTRKLKQLKIEPIIELFLPGFMDFSENLEELVQNCQRYKENSYLVHTPLYDIRNKYIFDVYSAGNDKIELLLYFCSRINSKILIIHRCYGFDKGIDKSEAEVKFLEKIVLWNGLAEKMNVKLLIENYGFVWLPEFLGIKYLVSPLDHFFPWDIIKFNQDIRKVDLNNVGIIMDIAHAVLSSNMFNILKTHPIFNSDHRFKNIYKADLDRKDFLRVDDFIFDFIDHYHISDTFIWSRKDGVGDLKKYLYTENLPIGKGNINYKNIFAKLSGEKTMIMEINPENNDYNNNVSQLDAIEKFKTLFN